MDWLTAAEALALLGTQPQTLYANVSRGRIKARRDPADSRKSLYRGDDVRRLAQRAAGRRKQEAVAAAAIDWGEPVLPTRLSTVQGGRLLYRGVDAVVLAETATLEDVARLLWQAPCRVGDAGPQSTGYGLRGAFLALAARAAEPAGQMLGPAALGQQAGVVLDAVAAALCGQSDLGLPLHARLAEHWERPEAADIIRRSLVLLADHELNASTFAARVAVSTGASLWAGALAGLATLNGPRHGLASRSVTALAEDIGSEPAGASAALRDWLDEGRAVPGMGHPLYPDGDVRSTALLECFDVPPAFIAFRAAAEAITGDVPNVDFALAAMAKAYQLPTNAPLVLFALARSVGWLAHGIEQASSGQLIRPRAHYLGPGAAG
ncbi:citrate synthase [Devosia aquimaris]|uniref:citrate synthase n=1 Tax=Devosia aquimaris TaxID=2866214 RepID=UPI001CD18A44|nr:citrate synthase [Devosia sp. CJK-A8-3]